VDLSDVKVGVAVTHKVFGEGIIAEINENRIYVSFGKAKKMFLLPDAFEGGFLKL